MKQSFSLENFIRTADTNHFTMTITANEENFIEIEIRPANNPLAVFTAVIEKDVIFNKRALDGFRQHFGKYLRKTDKKFTVKNLYSKFKK